MTRSLAVEAVAFGAVHDEPRLSELTIEGETARLRERSQRVVACSTARARRTNTRVARDCLVHVLGKASVYGLDQRCAFGVVRQAAWTSQVAIVEARAVASQVEHGARFDAARAAQVRLQQLLVLFLQLVGRNEHVSVIGRSGTRIMIAGRPSIQAAWRLRSRRASTTMAAWRPRCGGVARGRVGATGATRLRRLPTAG